MRLLPLLIIMAFVGVVATTIYPHLITVLVMFPVSVAIGWAAGRSNRRRELP